jgi:chitinase
MGGADFHIAMTDMLLAGFPVAGNTANVFPALREDQVAFGAPSSVSAGNGYVAPSAIQQAVGCLVRGTNCGSYTPRSGTNPNFRGLMTWSINWDRFYNYEFQNQNGAYLKSLA